MNDEQSNRDEHFMRVAIEQSKLGNYPYGAVLVKDNELKFKAHNTGNDDPTAHAEINLIREATKALGTASLRGYTLYTSSESCPMCAAAEIWAGVSRVVYGASIQQLIEVGQSQIEISSSTVNQAGFIHYELTGGVLAEEALAVVAKN